VRRTMFVGFALLLVVPMVRGAGGEVHAQELPPKVELPPPAPGPCEAEALLAFFEEEISDADRERARGLLSEANQAAILGDDGSALELLREAAELDPEDPEIAYRLGRLLEGADEVPAAIREYCRYLLLAPEGSDAEEVDARVEALAGPEEDEIPAVARVAFQQGVTALEGSSYEEAVLHFSRALVELPNWPEAHYNRGLAYLGDGRTGAAESDLERYLELLPDASDRALVEVRLERLAPQAPTRSAGTALLTGMVFPGMGHFYLGSNRAGLLVLAGAGAAAATGVLYTEVTERCRVPAVDGSCPAGEVASREVERALLVPGLAVAGAVTLVGAIHAFRRAGRSGEGSIALTPDSRGVLVGLDVVGLGSGAAALELSTPPPGRLQRIRAGLRVRF
jgi:hypothetical protein